MNDRMNVKGTAFPTSPATPIPLSAMAITGPMNPTEIAVTSHTRKLLLRSAPAEACA